MLPFEAVHALYFSGQYAGERLAEAAGSLSKYGIELVSFDSIGQTIAEITHSVGITAYDAAYVALAIERDAMAYTADSTLMSDLDGSGYESAVAHIRTY